MVRCLLYIFVFVVSFHLSFAQIQIGVAKQAGVVNYLGNNSTIYEIPYTITLKNLGTVAATNVQVTDNLLSAFPAPVSILGILNITADSPLTLNQAFDGKSNIQLLTGNNTLPVGTATYTIRFTVRVNLNNSTTVTYNNQVTATTATTTGGAATSTDISDNGTDPDPNNNKNPGDAGESDVTPVSLGSATSFFCKGISGPNLIANGDFGSGTSNVGPALSAGVTDYVYSATDLSAEGSYSIVRNVVPLKSDWTITSDHTGNTNGYYMAVNANNNPDIFFKQTISGLCLNTTYEFSLWVRNQHYIFTKTNKPLIEFLIDGVTAFTATPVPENNQWTKQGFIFNSGNKSTITISIRNAEKGSDGNDLGIDDLSLVACLPNPVVNTSSLPVCVGSDAIITAKIPDYNTNYSQWNYSQWERSTDGGGNWSVIAGPFAGTPPFAFNAGPATLAMNGHKYRLKVATTSANLSSSGCFAISGTTTLQVGAGVAFTTAITQPTCALTDGKLTIGNIAASDSVSIDGGSFVRANATSLNFTNLITGAHTVSVRRFPCQKDTLFVLRSPANCGPVIGLAKRVSPAVAQANGTFNATYTFVVKNYGTVPLTNVQVTDNLSSVITSPSTFSIVAGSTVATGTLIANTGFNGNSDKNLLASGSTLGVGATQTITFTVNISPNAFFGPYNNTATASANGGTGTTTAISNDGNDADLNNNGIPNESSERNTTILRIDARPVIGAAKLASYPVLQTDDSYNITYTITIKNYGNVDLSAVQVTDDLLTAFPSPLTYTIKSAPVATGRLTANTAFNGSSDKNLLQSASSTLLLGDEQTITFTINVKLNGGSGRFNNTVTASASGPGSSGSTSDVSTDGNDPDPNKNNNPADTGENKATGVDLPAKPVIGIAKSASVPVLQPNGSYNIIYTLTLQNLGSEDLSNIKVSDNLSLVFPSPVTFSVISTPIATGNLTVQTGFNGTTVTDLLAGNGGTLSVGASASISFTVNVVPNGSFGPFGNNALASGQGLRSNVIVKDLSNAGTEADPNNNNNPSDAGNEDNPTVVTLTPNPVIGIAKSASVPALQSNGTYNVNFTITVKNFGNTTLNNVSVTDNLRATFPNPVTFTLAGSPITTNGFTPNTSFNGIANIELLASGNSLAVGQSATISFTVNIVPNGSFGPFLNSALGSATGTNNVKTSDFSNAGNDPDPDNDNDPSDGGDNDLPTVIKLSPNPVIGISEQAGTPVLQADGSYNVTYTITIENLGNVNLNTLQITNNLTSTFPGPVVYKIVTPPAGAGLTTNTGVAGFDGASFQNLLSGSNTLNIGEKKILTFTINLFPNGSFGPFENTSVATGKDVGSTARATDISNDGIETDPNKNGNPTEPDENNPTPVKLLPLPRIGVAKLASAPTLQPNGSYTITYTIKVKNLGNVDLTAVQVTEDFTTAFPNPATITLVGNVSATGNLIVNTAFNGKTDTRLLVSSGSNPSTLALNTEQTITFTVNVVPNGLFGPFSNSVRGSADGANNTGKTSDISQTGTNPDPDGNGNPDESDNNNPTVVLLPANAVMGIAKSVATPVIQPDGSYSVTYTFTVKNYGNVNISNVQITDDFTSVFTSPVTFTFVGNPVSSDFTINPNFNGIADKNMLAAGNTLNIGETKTITLKLNVITNGSLGPFNNAASISGTSMADGKVVSDLSANGSNPDPNNDNNPSETGATPVTFPPPTPTIGVAKMAGRPVIQQDGSYTIAYSIKVKNLGNVNLNNIQVTENLAAVFPAPTTFSVVSGTLTATRGLVVNSGFTGSGSAINLLAANQSMGLADSSVISFTVKIVVTTSFGPFKNSVTALAAGAGNTGNTTDISTNGTNPDPNGNGKPNDAGEDVTTDITITPTPVIGLAKAVSSPVPQPNTGSNHITYTLTVMNMGNVVLNNVQITDDLTKTFTGAVFNIVAGSISATGGLIPNLTFDGKTQTSLLAANNTLIIGASGTITFTVNVTGSGIFSNSAVASGTGMGNTGNVTDVSVSGTNPDPNNNGTPNDTGEDTPTQITIAKSDLVIPEGFSPNGDGVNDNFILQGQGVLGVNMEIFNRWGNLVYKNENYKNDWNGTCNTGIYFGQDLPDGTYYYVIKLSDGRKYVSFLTLNR
jgi:gliding motility-associated-like protein/uncharacterized repeat protein (TIGR01451 family)